MQCPLVLKWDSGGGGGYECKNSSTFWENLPVRRQECICLHHLPEASQGSGVEVVLTLELSLPQQLD